MAQKKYVALSNLPVVFTAVKNYVDRSIDAIPPYVLSPATATAIGGVKPGSGLAVGADGTLTVTGEATVNSVEWAVIKNVPKASGTAIGLVKIGSNINVAADGTISVAAPVTKTSQLTNDSSYVTTTQMTTAISTAKSEIIGGAPETYDTLKEIADYIATHASVETALNAAIGNKADKSYVDTTFVKEADLVAATEAEINTAADGVFDAA